MPEYYESVEAALRQENCHVVAWHRLGAIPMPSYINYGNVPADHIDKIMKGLYRAWQATVKVTTA